MSGVSISYKTAGEGFTAQILPEGITGEQRLQFITDEAVRLIPQINIELAESLSDHAFPNPTSYRKFSALQWLANQIDRSKCPADWGSVFKNTVAASEGAEPEIGQKGAFIIDYHGISVRITYDPMWLGTTDHLTFESIAPNRHPLPNTETGYRSHFFDRRALSGFCSIKAYALELLDSAAKETANNNWQQQSLF